MGNLASSGQTADFPARVLLCFFHIPAHSEHQEIWAGPSWSSYAFKVRSVLYLVTRFHLNPFYYTVIEQVVPVADQRTCSGHPMIHRQCGVPVVVLYLCSMQTKSVGCVRHAAELQAVAHQGGGGVQLLCCFWSACWAPPGIRALGVSAGGGGAVGLRQSGSLGCCVWPASTICPPCNQKK
jgi:hypothetical protein